MMIGAALFNARNGLDKQQAVQEKLPNSPCTARNQRAFDRLDRDGREKPPVCSCRINRCCTRAGCWRARNYTK